MRKLFCGLLSLIWMLCLAGCAGTKQMTMFASGDTASAVVSQAYEPVIECGDELLIMFSSVDPEVVAPYNAGYTTYPVQSNGCVTLPILGAIHVAGLTELQAGDSVAARVGSQVKNAVVRLNLTTKSVTVLGEVNHPGCFPIRSDYTLLYALGLAGGLTVNARLDNVLLIRQEGQGMVQYRLDLRSNDLFASPCYRLRKGDVVYVSPLRSRRVR